MKTLAQIEARAVQLAGGAEAFAERLPKPKTGAALRKIGDDKYLSTMSQRIFAAGLKHSMVRDKWPAFEEAFLGFDPKRVAALSDEALEGLMKDRRIIRHWGKIGATRVNAIAMSNIAAEHGSFGRWIADWPSTDIVGLWEVLKREFAQLGGMSGPMFLRWMGKDTFMLSKDVVRALNGLGVAKGGFTGKKDRLAAQAAFNGWMAESGKPLSQISMTLAIFAGTG